MGTRVNSSSINASGASGSSYGTTLGVAVLAGDVIVVCMQSNGTHAANGMAVQDSVNGIPFTTVLEEDLTNLSSRWLQAFVYQTPVDLPSGTTITATPYVANSASSFCVDVFRGYSSSQVVTATGANSPSGTAATGAAFSVAPATGSLVISFAGNALSTLSIASPYTLGSNTTTTTTTAIAYVLSADGVSTYSAAWTSGASVSWAVIDAGFQLVVSSNIYMAKTKFPWELISIKTGVR